MFHAYEHFSHFYLEIGYVLHAIVWCFFCVVQFQFQLLCYFFFRVSRTDSGTL